MDNPSIQKCFKEGVKKAHLFSTMNKASDSSLSYFCTIIESAEGRLDLLVAAMEGANSNKKAREWGKFFVSSNDTQIVGYGHVPQSLCSTKDNGLDVNEWGEDLVKVLPRYERMKTDDENTERFGFTFDIEGSKIGGGRGEREEEVFPFKLCDSIVQRSIDLLKKRGLIESREESDDDMCNYADAAGVEW